MVTVTIAGESRPLEDASESWITQAINRRRQDGLLMCVQVAFNLSGLNITLGTPACARFPGGGGPPLNANELEVLALWKKHGLDREEFAPGNVVAFLKQFRRLAAA